MILNRCRHIFGIKWISKCLLGTPRDQPLINKITIATAFNESGAYDGDGKTVATILQNDYGDEMNLIKGFSPVGFRLSNRAFVYGSIIMFPTSAFAWNVARSTDVNMESLILFDLILPKIKMLVIGYGDLGDKYDASIPMLLKKKGINCEMLPTCHASTTYNYLATDGIHVAGAFIPPKQVQTRTKDGLDNHMDFLHNRKRKDVDTKKELPNTELKKYVLSTWKKFSPKDAPDKL